MHDEALRNLYLCKYALCDSPHITLSYCRLGKRLSKRFSRRVSLVIDQLVLAVPAVQLADFFSNNL